MTRVVGLTGGIGTGKSTVSRMLRELGAAIVDADQLAREAVAKGSPALAEIAARFGPSVLLPDGTLDRAALGARVFRDEVERRALNAIVHPRVAALSAERISRHVAEGAKVVVYDVPLLYENNLDRMLPEVVVVTAPPEVQRSRLASRDGLSPEEVEARIAAQMPLAEKAKRAQHVIDNGGPIEATLAQVRALWALLGGS